jgi:phage terminase large subunit-like protein
MRGPRQAARAIRELAQRRGVDVARTFLASLSRADRAAIARCWQLHARANQLRPDDPRPIWLLCTGRGFGKSRSAAEYTLDMCEDWGRGLEGALISIKQEAINTEMLHGKGSGLLECAERRGYRLRVHWGTRPRVVHPSGAVLHMVSMAADSPGRGKNLNFFWGDEPSSWGPNALERFKTDFFSAWRMNGPNGARKCGVLTTTPKPNPIMRWLLKDRAAAKLVKAIGGNTYENAANIDPTEQALALEGTRSGQQELWGILLDSNSVLEIETITQHRIRHGLDQENIARRVLAIDPSIDDKAGSDACGLCVAECDFGPNPHAYILEDGTIQGASWSGWAKAAINLAIKYGVREIVAEINQGGKGIESNLIIAMDEAIEEGRLAARIPIVSVWHQESKRARAEPCAALSEKGRVHHVGFFPKLEDELTTWVEGTKSPNRMDAWAMAITALLLGDYDKAPPFYVVKDGPIETDGLFGFGGNPV